MSLRNRLHVIGYVGHGCGLLGLLAHNILEIQNSTIVVGEPEIKPEPIKYHNIRHHDMPEIQVTQACFTDFGMGENIKRGSDRHYTKQNKYRANQHNFRKR